ncbi:MAG: VOC family protein [Blautia sp.]|nr:VOC family protein [Blautia sp.]
MRITDYTEGLAHIGIPTKDMMESLIFYTELGFDVVHTTTDPKDGSVVNFLQLGNLMLEVYECSEAHMCHGAIEHFAISVNDIEGAYDFICSRGINTLNDEIHFLPFWDNGVKYFTIEGPNKEKVEFAQRL